MLKGVLIGYFCRKDTFKVVKIFCSKVKFSLLEKSIL